jgi:hypothetical protein
MYRFFRDNAKNIAYETYFNGDTGEGNSSLCPGNMFPKAAATYKADWSSGR